MISKFFIYIDKKLERLGLIKLFLLKIRFLYKKRGLVCPLKNVYSMYKYSFS